MDTKLLIKNDTKYNSESQYHGFKYKFKCAQQFVQNIKPIVKLYMCV